MDMLTMKRTRNTSTLIATVAALLIAPTAQGAEGKLRQRPKDLSGEGLGAHYGPLVHQVLFGGAPTSVSGARVRFLKGHENVGALTAWQHPLAHRLMPLMLSQAGVAIHGAQMVGRKLDKAGGKIVDDLLFYAQNRSVVNASSLGRMLLIAIATEGLDDGSRGFKPGKPITDNKLIAAIPGLSDLARAELLEISGYKPGDLAADSCEHTKGAREGRDSLLAPEAHPEALRRTSVTLALMRKFGLGELKDKSTIYINTIGSRVKGAKISVLKRAAENAEAVARAKGAAIEDVSVGLLYRPIRSDHMVIEMALSGVDFGDSEVQRAAAECRNYLQSIRESHESIYDVFDGYTNTFDFGAEDNPAPIRNFQRAAAHLIERIRTAMKTGSESLQAGKVAICNNGELAFSFGAALANESRAEGVGTDLRIGPGGSAEAAESMAIYATLGLPFDSALVFKSATQDDQYATRSGIGTIPFHKLAAIPPNSEDIKKGRVEAAEEVLSALGQFTRDATFGVAGIDRPNRARDMVLSQETMVPGPVDGAQAMAALLPFDQLHDVKMPGVLINAEKQESSAQVVVTMPTGTALAKVTLEHELMPKALFLGRHGLYKEAMAHIDGLNVSARDPVAVLFAKLNHFVTSPPLGADALYREGGWLQEVTTAINHLGRQYRMGNVDPRDVVRSPAVAAAALLSPKFSKEADQKMVQTLRKELANAVSYFTGFVFDDIGERQLTQLEKASQ